MLIHLLNFWQSFRPHSQCVSSPNKSVFPELSKVNLFLIFHLKTLPSVPCGHQLLTVYAFSIWAAAATALRAGSVPEWTGWGLKQEASSDSLRGNTRRCQAGLGPGRSLLPVQMCCSVSGAVILGEYQLLQIIRRPVLRFIIDVWQPR